MISLLKGTLSKPEKEIKSKTHLTFSKYLKRKLMKK